MLFFMRLVLRRDTPLSADSVAICRWTFSPAAVAVACAEGRRHLMPSISFSAGFLSFSLLSLHAFSLPLFARYAERRHTHTGRYHYHFSFSIMVAWVIFIIFSWPPILRRRCRHDDDADYDDFAIFDDYFHRQRRCFLRRRPLMLLSFHSDDDDDIYRHDTVTGRRRQFLHYCWYCIVIGHCHYY